MQEETIAPLDPIEGSDDLSMMTISINFEGSFAQLVKFVNLLDRSPRFLIIESMQVSPQPKGDVLNANPQTARLRQRRFARSAMKTGAEPKKVAILAALLVAGAVVMYLNVFSGDSETKRPAAPAAVAIPAPAPGTYVAPRATPAAAADRRRTAKNNLGSEFKFRQGQRARRRKARPGDHRSHSQARPPRQAAERGTARLHAEYISIRRRAASARPRRKPWSCRRTRRPSRSTVLPSTLRARRHPLPRPPRRP